MSDFLKRIDPETLKKIQQVRASTAPVDLRRLARELGVTVVYEALRNGLRGKVEPKIQKWKPGSLEAPKPHFVVTINTNYPKSLQNFTLAHELAHVMLHQDQILKSIDTVEHWDDGPLFNATDELQIEKMEWEAQRTAAWLTTPFKQLAAYFTAYGLQPLPVVAEAFGVSQGMMKIRLHEYNRWASRRK